MNMTQNLRNVKAGLKNWFLVKRNRVKPKLKMNGESEKGGVKTKAKEKKTRKTKTKEKNR